MWFMTKYKLLYPFVLLCLNVRDELLWSCYVSSIVQVFVRCNVFYWERKTAFSFSVHILLGVCVCECVYKVFSEK